MDVAALEQELDAEVRQFGGIRKETVLGLLRPGEHLLGQRWPIIGRVGLVSDQDDAPFEALATQSLGGSQPAEPRADDDDRVDE